MKLKRGSKEHRIFLSEQSKRLWNDETYREKSVKSHTIFPVGTSRFVPQLNRFRIKCDDGSWKIRARYFMEQKVGRKLTKHEHVHHIDGDPLNDNIDNLVIINEGIHHSQHMQGYKHNETFCRKLSLRCKGVKHSEKHRRNNSLAHIGKGKPHTPESRSKLSRIHKGKKYDPNTNTYVMKRD